MYFLLYYRNVYKNRKINAYNCYKTILNVIKVFRNLVNYYYVYISTLTIKDISIVNKNVNKIFETKAIKTSILRNCV